MGIIGSYTCLQGYVMFGLLLLLVVIVVIVVVALVVSQAQNSRSDAHNNINVLQLMPQSVVLPALLAMSLSFSLSLYHSLSLSLSRAGCSGSQAALAC